MAILLGAVDKNMSILTSIQKKSLKSYKGLFDLEFVSIFLKHYGYKSVSFRKKSIPNQGSPTYNLSSFMKNIKKEISKSIFTNIIFSANGNVTIKTKYGYFQYF